MNVELLIHRSYFHGVSEAGAYYTAELRYADDHDEAWHGAADTSRETAEKRAEEYAAANGWTIVSRTLIEV